MAKSFQMLSFFQSFHFHERFAESISALYVFFKSFQDHDFSHIEIVWKL